METLGRFRPVLVMIVLLLVPALWAPDAGAAELRYKWKKGAVHRFETTAHQTMNMSMGAMGGMTQKTVTTSTFALVIRKVRGDGLAEADLYVERFQVKDDAGRQVAGIDSIPAKALSSLVEIDTKGHFTFKEIVYILIDPKGGEQLLVSASAGPNGASASATANGEKVSVYARFDSKTGQVKAGASITRAKVKKQRKIRVAVKQDAQRVDVLPVQFLEMLRLPDGPMVTGDSAKIDAAGYVITMTADEVTARSASIRTQITTEAGAGTPARAAKSSVEANTSSGSMDMNLVAAMGAGGVGEMPAMPGMPGLPAEAGMPGMPAMPGMPGMPGAPGMDGGSEASPAAGATGQMAPKITGDFVMGFAVAKGALDRIDGEMTLKMSLAGMGQMDTTTKLAMKRIP